MVARRRDTRTIHAFHIDGIGRQLVLRKNSRNKYFVIIAIIAVLCDKRTQLSQNRLCVAKRLFGNRLAKLGCLLLCQSRAVSVDLLHCSIYIRLLCDQLFLIVFPELLDVCAVAFAIIVAQVVDGSIYPVCGGICRKIFIVENLLNVTNTLVVFTLKNIRSIR